MAKPPYLSAPGAPAERGRQEPLRQETVIDLGLAVEGQDETPVTLSPETGDNQQPAPPRQDTVDRRRIVTAKGLKSGIRRGRRVGASASESIAKAAPVPRRNARPTSGLRADDAVAMGTKAGRVTAARQKRLLKMVQARCPPEHPPPSVSA